MNKPSIEEQYDGLVYRLLQYFKLRNKLAKRLQRRIKYLWFGNSKAISEQITYNLFGSNRQTDWTINKLNAIATEQEKANPLFDLAVSIYPQESLAVYLETLFPDTNFKAIASIYNLRKKPFIIFGTKEKIGTIFGLGTLLIKSVPESILQAIGLCKDKFEFWTFIVTVTFVFYVAIMIGIGWLVIDKRLKDQQEFVENMLHYLSTRYDMNKEAAITS